MLSGLVCVDVSCSKLVSKYDSPSSFFFPLYPMIISWLGKMSSIAWMLWYPFRLSFLIKGEVFLSSALRASRMTSSSLISCAPVGHVRPSTV